MDYELLASVRHHHAAWRLLAADNAPFVIGFLYESFVRPNARALSDDVITPKLDDDYLHQLRERLGDEAPPRSAREDRQDWADDARGWLRRYYPRAARPTSTRLIGVGNGGQGATASTAITATLALWNV